MSRYAVYITPAAVDGIRALPAELRQKVKRTISALQEDPMHRDSRLLDPHDLRLALKPGQTVHCLRMEGGRIIYTVNETRQIVDVLAVRPRPPYDYDYIKRLMAKIK